MFVEKKLHTFCKDSSIIVVTLVRCEIYSSVLVKYNKVIEILYRSTKRFLHVSNYSLLS